MGLKIRLMETITNTVGILENIQIEGVANIRKDRKLLIPTMIISLLGQNKMAAVIWPKRRNS